MRNSSKLTLVAVVFFGASPAWAEGSDWAVSEASGRVFVRAGTTETPISRGSVIHPGQTVITAAGSRAVLVHGDDFVTVAATSRMRVPDAAARGMVQMLVEWGTGMFQIKHTDKPHFGVQTPYLAAVVKGTTFTVTASAEGSSLQVTDGAVGVATLDGGAEELIRPGVVASISATDRYRLVVRGQQTHVIDSPLRATAPADPAASASPGAAAGTSTDSAHADEFAWAEVASSVITQAFEAKPVDMGAATGGLVANGSAAAKASAAVIQLARADQALSDKAGAPGGAKDNGNGGNDNGGAKDNGNGGNDNGGAKDNGNGGNDNGGAKDNGNGGNDNGGAKDNGNGGNDNGGAKDNGNGGNDNGGAKDNGNGGNDGGNDKGGNKGNGGTKGGGSGRGGKT